VAVVEKGFVRVMDAWAKHKRQFRGVWDAVADNLDGSTAVLFEEIGIESDEAVGEMLSTYQQLLPKKVCRR
jgi:26S proteasome regulatory subunit (ATPase 3-interacting protein)